MRDARSAPREEQVMRTPNTSRRLSRRSASSFRRSSRSNSMSDIDDSEQFQPRTTQRKRSAEQQVTHGKDSDDEEPQIPAADARRRARMSLPRQASTGKESARVGGSGPRDKTSPDVAVVLNCMFWLFSVAPKAHQYQRLHAILTKAQQQSWIEPQAKIDIPTLQAWFRNKRYSTKKHMKLTQDLYNELADEFRMTNLIDLLGADVITYS